MREQVTYRDGGRIGIAVLDVEPGEMPRDRVIQLQFASIAEL